MNIIKLTLIINLLFSNCLYAMEDPHYTHRDSQGYKLSTKTGVRSYKTHVHDYSNESDSGEYPNESDEVSVCFDDTTLDTLKNRINLIHGRHIPSIIIPKAKIISYTMSPLPDKFDDFVQLILNPAIEKIALLPTKKVVVEALLKNKELTALLRFLESIYNSRKGSHHHNTHTVWEAVWIVWAYMEIMSTNTKSISIPTTSEQYNVTSLIDTISFYKRMHTYGNEDNFLLVKTKELYERERFIEVMLATIFMRKSEVSDIDNLQKYFIWSGIGLTKLHSLSAIDNAILFSILTQLPFTLPDRISEETLSSLGISIIKSSLGYIYSNILDTHSPKTKDIFSYISNSSTNKSNIFCLLSEINQIFNKIVANNVYCNIQKVPLDVYKTYKPTEHDLIKTSSLIPEVSINPSSNNIVSDTITRQINELTRTLLSETYIQMESMHDLFMNSFKDKDDAFYKNISCNTDIIQAICLLQTTLTTNLYELYPNLNEALSAEYFLGQYYANHKDEPTAQEHYEHVLNCMTYDSYYKNSMIGLTKLSAYQFGPNESKYFVLFQEPELYRALITKFRADIENVYFSQSVVTSEANKSCQDSKALRIKMMQVRFNLFKLENDYSPPCKKSIDINNAISLARLFINFYQENNSDAGKQMIMCAARVLTDTCLIYIDNIEKLSAPAQLLMNMITSKMFDINTTNIKNKDQLIKTIGCSNLLNECIKQEGILRIAKALYGYNNSDAYCISYLLNEHKDITSYRALFTGALLVNKYATTEISSIVQKNTQLQQIMGNIGFNSSINIFTDWNNIANTDLPLSLLSEDISCKAATAAYLFLNTLSGPIPTESPRKSSKIPFLKTRQVSTPSLLSPPRNLFSKVKKSNHDKESDSDNSH